jgi:uncharacterized protein (DUF58 family)
MTLLQDYLDKWLDKRIPAADRHTLNHQNIFIFPAKFGGVFLLLCMLLFLLGTNYQNNLMLILCYFLLGIFLVNLLASYINFARINVKIGKCPEVFVKDNLHIPLWLNANSHGSLTLNGLLDFKFQTRQTKKQQKLTPDSITQVDVNDFSNPINISHRCKDRGKLVLSRLTISSVYPLGLYRCWTHLAFSHEIIVFPSPLPCEIELHKHQQPTSKKGTKIHDQQTGHDDFSHLKAYQVGEPLYHVAWKQLAKGRGMVSKQFSTLSSQIGWLRLSSSHQGGSEITTAQKLETELSKLSFQVIELSRTGQTFGLDLGQTCIVPNNGSSHRLVCLKALALYDNRSASL